MGLVQRCAVCGTEMLIERQHRGRTVPCPRCRAPYDVPENLDFLVMDVEAGRDRTYAGRLLVVVIAAGAACCLPVSAYVWWAAAGAIERAREEGRPVEPLLLSTRGCALVFTLVDGLMWLIAAAGFMLGWWGSF